MNVNERYKDPRAFRAALQDRMRLAAVGKDNSWLVRRRKLVVFDRLLARLVAAAPDRWLLKGAVALELRFGDHSRATMDLDLSRQDSEETALADLIAAQSLDIGDHFAFRIERTDKFENMTDATAVRYRVVTELAGLSFETTNLDIGFQDSAALAPEVLQGRDLLGFAGIPAIAVPAIPLAQHVAEKLHAYTRIYSDGRESSRVKDLINLAIIAENASFEADRLRFACVTTFGNRRTHPIPDSLPRPPRNWREPYRRMAVATGFDPDIDVGHASAAAFLDPILRQTAPQASHWDPPRGVWKISRLDW